MRAVINDDDVSDDEDDRIGAVHPQLGLSPAEANTLNDEAIGARDAVLTEETPAVRMALRSQLSPGGQRRIHFTPGTSKAREGAGRSRKDTEHRRRMDELWARRSLTDLWTRVAARGMPTTQEEWSDAQKRHKFLNMCWDFHQRDRGVRAPEWCVAIPYDAAHGRFTLADKCEPVDGQYLFGCLVCRQINPKSNEDKFILWGAKVNGGLGALRSHVRRYHGDGAEQPEDNIIATWLESEGCSWTLARSSSVSVPRAPRREDSVNDALRRVYGGGDEEAEFVDEEAQALVDHLLVAWHMQTNHAYSAVESEIFSAISRVIAGKSLRPLERRKAQDIENKLRDAVLADVRKALAEADYVALSFDEWAKGGDRKSICLNAHWHDPSGSSQLATLALRCGGATAGDLSTTLIEVAEREFPQLKGKVVGFTCDGDKLMESTRGKLRVSPGLCLPGFLIAEVLCGSHGLCTVSRKSWDDVEDTCLYKPLHRHVAQSLGLFSPNGKTVGDLFGSVRKAQNHRGKSSRAKESLECARYAIDEALQTWLLTSSDASCDIRTTVPKSDSHIASVFWTKLCALHRFSRGLITSNQTSGVTTSAFTLRDSTY